MDRFLQLTREQTRCPQKIMAIAPSAKKIYVLKERSDCRHWDLVRDLFHQVKGSHIVTEPTAGRKYFTLDPRTVIARLTRAGAW